jgi:hypothetical protein
LSPDSWYLARNQDSVKGVRLFADPRIPYLYSRFIVRETGFTLNGLSSFEFHLPPSMW